MLWIDTAELTAALRSSLAREYDLAVESELASLEDTEVAQDLEWWTDGVDSAGDDYLPLDAALPRTAAQRPEASVDRDVEGLLVAIRGDELRRAEARARKIAAYLPGEVQPPTGWDLLLTAVRRRAEDAERGQDIRTDRSARPHCHRGPYRHGPRSSATEESS